MLERSTTVCLSTDAYHEPGVSDRVYVNAARAIAAADDWIVVQVVDTEPMVERAQELLHAAFGDEWPDHAELCRNPPLTHGRGAAVFTPHARASPGHAYPPCTQLGSQTVRYDGLRHGLLQRERDHGLRPRRACAAARARRTRSARRSRPSTPTRVLRAIGGPGPGALTAHPRFADLAEREFTSICDLCWTMLDRVADDERSRPADRRDQRDDGARPMSAHGQ